MEEIKKIVLKTRGSGNTLWILKSAIKQPNCIIVSKDLKSAKQLENNYFQLLSKVSWIKRVFWKIIKRKNPKFLSINSGFDGITSPVIFDNSTF